MTHPLGHNAPVFPFEYGVEDLRGMLIWPCPDCLPWHVEIVEDPEDIGSGWLVREWHAADCPGLPPQDGDR